MRSALNSPITPGETPRASFFCKKTLRNPRGRKLLLVLSCGLAKNIIALLTAAICLIKPAMKRPSVLCVIIYTINFNMTRQAE